MIARQNKHCNHLKGRWGFCSFSQRRSFCVLQSPCNHLMGQARQTHNRCAESAHAAWKQLWMQQRKIDEAEILHGPTVYYFWWGPYFTQNSPRFLMKMGCQLGTSIWMPLRERNALKLWESTVLGELSRSRTLPRRERPCNSSASAAPAAGNEIFLYHNIAEKWWLS